MGDLNCNLSSKVVSNNSSYVLNIIDSYGLTQLITKLTRVMQHSSTLIDLCLRNSPDKISKSGVINIGISDPSAIIDLYLPFLPYPKFPKKSSMTKHITIWMKNNWIINEWFIKQRPALETNDSLCVNIDRGLPNGVIVVDLKKAFDCIDHQIILNKLKKYGVDQEALKCFKSYLTNRKQRCNVNNHLASASPIICVVPQGCIIGPLLLLI